jgi:hypothetical protein
VLDCVACFPKARLISPTPTAITTVAVFLTSKPVDGNTDGYFLNKSTTHTEYEHGAWWQVDLGSKKNINQIIIYNRTDCCANITDTNSNNNSCSVLNK